MESKTPRIVFAIIFLCFLSGCWRWDFTKFPLYDDIFIKEEPKVDTKNRNPIPENPRTPVNVNEEEKTK